MTHVFRLFAVLVLVLFAASGAQAAAVFADDGIAIRGYDPVAYFQQGKPVRGSASHTHEWSGATWRFASAASRDAFAADPQKYAPQYGGFCAWAVSQGYTASIDPQAWKVVDGRLYLNYSRGVQRTWERDVSGNIAKANGNWPGIRAKLGN
jgi:YHS domain-containing protein